MLLLLSFFIDFFLQVFSGSLPLPCPFFALPCLRLPPCPPSITRLPSRHSLRLPFHMLSHLLPIRLMPPRPFPRSRSCIHRPFFLLSLFSYSSKSFLFFVKCSVFLSCTLLSLFYTLSSLSSLPLSCSISGFLRILHLPCLSSLFPRAFLLLSSFLRPPPPCLFLLVPSSSPSLPPPLLLLAGSQASRLNGFHSLE